MPGKPDIVLTKYRTVIFVHGCFWHRHQGCKVATTPKSNTEFWIEKFSRNVARDAAALDQLHAAQWRVIIAWECDLGSVAKVSTKATEIAAQIQSTSCKDDDIVDQ